LEESYSEEEMINKSIEKKAPKRKIQQQATTKTTITTMTSLSKKLVHFNAGNKYLRWKNKKKPSSCFLYVFYRRRRRQMMMVHMKKVINYQKHFFLFPPLHISPVGPTLHDALALFTIKLHYYIIFTLFISFTGKN
jgi:hypothetical protein